MIRISSSASCRNEDSLLGQGLRFYQQFQPQKRLVEFLLNNA